MAELAGAALRELRHAAGLSLAGMAARTHYTKAYLGMIETGARRPPAGMTAAYEDALGAEGARVAHSLARPRSADAATAAALAAALAAQRRLDDTVGPHIILPAAGPQSQTVLRLARDARGPAAGALHEVAAEWTQFLGWLRAGAGLPAAATQTLDEAIGQADALGHGPLSAQARNFRGYVERQRGNPPGMVRYFLAAYQTPGASVLQRVGDAAQAAHGYGLLGDRPAAVRLLGEASDLLSAAEETPPGTAYWLSPAFSRLNLGLAYLGLGDHAEAAGNLRAGLAGLPPDQQAAPWSEEYRRHLAEAEDPDRPTA